MTTPTDAAKVIAEAISATAHIEYGETWMELDNADECSAAAITMLHRAGLVLLPKALVEEAAHYAEQEADMCDAANDADDGWTVDSRWCPTKSRDLATRLREHLGGEKGGSDA